MNRIEEIYRGFPDLSTLPNRMRYAAKVMREAIARGGHTRPLWSCVALDDYADQWEAEDRAEAARYALAEELALELAEELALEFHAARWPHGADPTRGAYLPDYLAAARILIESGWRKGDLA